MIDPDRPSRAVLKARQALEEAQRSLDEAREVLRIAESVDELARRSLPGKRPPPIEPPTRL